MIQLKIKHIEIDDRISNPELNMNSKSDNNNGVSKIDKLSACIWRLHDFTASCNMAYDESDDDEDNEGYSIQKLN